MSTRSAGDGRAQRAGDRLAWLGGAKREVLADVPTERDRFVSMALVLLTTSSLAVVSMTFALSNGMKVPIVAAAVFGLMWGLVILNLDRFLVTSMGSIRSLGHLTLMALPRLAMAVVLAAVISTPLVLQVFHSDIKTEMDRYRDEQSVQQAAIAPQTAEQKRLDDLDKQIAAKQHILDGNLPDRATTPALDAAKEKVKELQGEVTAAQKAADRSLAGYQCEVSGTRCVGSSRKRGYGPIANLKRATHERDVAKVTSLQHQLTVAVHERDAEDANARKRGATQIAALGKQANAELPGLRKERDTLAAQIAARAEGRTATNANDTGILAQLRALSRVGDKNSALRIAHLLVAALFFLIEILPVVVKILLNLGARSAYDTQAELKEDELRDKAVIHRDAQRQIEADKSQNRIDLEKNMREHERRVGEQANERVARQMSDIVEAALADWSDRVQQDLASHAAGNGNGNGHAAGNGNGNGNGAGRGGRFKRNGAHGPAQGNFNNGYAMPPVDNL